MSNDYEEDNWVSIKKPLVLGIYADQNLENPGLCNPDPERGWIIPIRHESNGFPRFCACFGFDVDKINRGAIELNYPVIIFIVIRI